MLKHIPTHSKKADPHTSILMTEFSGTANEISLIQNDMADQRQGHVVLTKHLVHSIELGTCYNKFGSHFVYKEEEKGVTKTIGTFTIEFFTIAFQTHFCQIIWQF